MKDRTTSVWFTCLCLLTGYGGVIAIISGHTCASIWIRIEGWQAVCAGILMLSLTIVELINRYKDFSKHGKRQRNRGMRLIIAAALIVFSPLFTFHFWSIGSIHRVLGFLSIVMLCILGHELNEFTVRSKNSSDGK